MNIYSPATTSHIARSYLGVVTMALLLSACSTPHGYGVDERAMRSPDGSSGVVAGSEAPGSNARTPAVHSQSTYLSLIIQMQKEGQYFASLAHLDTYDARYGRSAESILLRGDAERLTDQPELAARSYALLKDTPQAGAGYRGLSLLAGARGDFATAAGLLEESLKFNSTDAVTLSDLGYARLQQGDLAGARVPLMTAAQLAPSNAKVMSNLALYLVLNHDTKEAEAVMKSAGVTTRTRQAIYAQASQMSGVRNAAAGQSDIQIAAATGAHVDAMADNIGIAASPSATSALRIDFALAMPQPGSAVDATIAAAKR